jgi:hypothetical protein
LPVWYSRAVSEGDENDYKNLAITDEFLASLAALDPPLSPEDAAGVFDALDELDARPTDPRNRLHALDRELTGWWSLTPPSPPGTALRVLVEPVRTAAGTGYWHVGPATWHYQR